MSEITSGGAGQYIQLGDSGGYETSGYTGADLSGESETEMAHGASWQIADMVKDVSGIVNLAKTTNNNWVISSQVVSNPLTGTGSSLDQVSGHKQLSGTLDRIRILSASSSPNTGTSYSNGSIQIYYS